jgi:hypothetical protein
MAKWFFLSNVIHMEERRGRGWREGLSEQRGVLVLEFRV